MAVVFNKGQIAPRIVTDKLISLCEPAEAIRINGAGGHIVSFIDRNSGQPSLPLVESPELCKHICVREFPVSLANDALCCVEMARFDDRFKDAVGANPHFRAILHPALLQLE